MYCFRRIEGYSLYYYKYYHHSSLHYIDQYSELSKSNWYLGMSLPIRLITQPTSQTWLAWHTKLDFLPLEPKLYIRATTIGPIATISNNWINVLSRRLRSFWLKRERSHIARYNLQILGNTLIYSQYQGV